MPKRKTSALLRDTILAPSPERYRQGTIERELRQIQDADGNAGSPFRTLDTLQAMERKGTITRPMLAAGERFREAFHLAHLETLRASDPGRIRGTASAAHMSGTTLDARRQVHESLKALGGIGSPAGCCVWQVVGLDRSLRDWALREGWCGRPLDQKAAAGILIGALGVLAGFYEIG